MIKNGRYKKARYYANLRKRFDGKFGGSESYLFGSAGVDTVKLALKYKTGSTSLDIGCGDGPECVAIIAKKRFNVTGMDISSVAIEKAKQFLKNKKAKAKLVVGNFLTAEVKKFDFITMNFVLHLFEEDDKKKVMEKIIAHTKPGGINAITVITRPNNFTDINKNGGFEARIKKFYEHNGWKILDYSKELCRGNKKSDEMYYRYIIAQNKT